MFTICVVLCHKKEAIIFSYKPYIFFHAITLSTIRNFEFDSGIWLRLWIIIHVSLHNCALHTRPLEIYWKSSNQIRICGRSLRQKHQHVSMYWACADYDDQPSTKLNKYFVLSSPLYETLRTKLSDSLLALSAIDLITQVIPNEGTFIHSNSIINLNSCSTYNDYGLDGWMHGLI